MLKNFVVFVFSALAQRVVALFPLCLLTFAHTFRRLLQKKLVFMCGELSAPENRSVAKKKELRRCFLFSPLMVLDIP